MRQVKGLKRSSRRERQLSIEGHAEQVFG